MNRREQMASVIGAGYLLASTIKGGHPDQDEFTETILNYTDTLLDALSGVSDRSETQSIPFAKLAYAVKDLTYGDLQLLDEIVARELIDKAPKDQNPGVSDEQALLGISHLLNHCSLEALENLQMAITLRLQENPTDDELLKLLGDRGGLITPSPWEVDESEIPTVILPNE
jgi:hypothetical protein